MNEPKTGVSGSAETDQLIGLTFDQAVRHAMAKGLRVRATYKDGAKLVVDHEYRTDRVNVAITDGVVSEVLGRG